MLKITAQRPPSVPAPPIPAPLTPVSRPRRRQLIYQQIRTTTRHLVHPFVMALGWPSAATVYHRRRLLEAALIGLLLAELLLLAILLLSWLAPPPPLVVQVGEAKPLVITHFPTQPLGLHWQGRGLNNQIDLYLR